MKHPSHRPPAAQYLGQTEKTPRLYRPSGAKPRANRQTTPVTTRQWGRTSGQQRRRLTDGTSAKQYLGQTEETPHLHRPSEAKPRANQQDTPLAAPQRSGTSDQQRNRPTESHSARQYLGQTEETPQSPPASGTKPRTNQQTTPLTAIQRSKTSAKPKKHHAPTAPAEQNLEPIEKTLCSPFAELAPSIA